MSQKELERRRTFELAKEFISVSRKLDGLIRSKKWKRWKDFRINRLRPRSAELGRVIGDRYKGLFLQIFNGLKKRQFSANCSFERFLDTWWDIVEQPIMGAVKEEEVSHVFWTAAEFAANAVFGAPVSAIEALRPKFMLRPLVDEIGDAAKRNALLTMGYEPHSSSAISHYPAEMQYQIGVAACEALFDALSGIEKLEELTNGAVQVSLLKDRKTGSDQLRSWLFGAW